MIDASRIEELRAEIGDDDLSFIVSVYLEEARSTLHQVAGGLPQPDYVRAVHFLRSGALNLGLCGIAVLAGQMERDIVDGTVIQQTLGARQLGDALDQTMAELETALA
ncbi:hypothetical protein JDO7802_01421 [Jannaschia donghaensis]|uniref:Hpt domain protein n=2 Tax=Jannaschia donghaensis TaxID=420998 RepID=A0A0M6YGD2_9RHOB|nr:hypothetical protein JDO7802_01421 [Jannaschia donghaensis]